MTSNCCEFCEELRQEPSSRFARAYGPAGHSCRVLFEADGYVVMPTLGPITPRSLLVLPRLHIETIARCATEIPGNGLWACLEWAKGFAVGESLHRVVMFEHGARRESAAGCGIYHAHVHVIPIPIELKAEDVFPEGESLPDVTAALSELEKSRAYLWFADTSLSVRALSIDDRPASYPSQYFRRLISKCVGEKSWDWKEREQPEESVLALLS